MPNSTAEKPRRQLTFYLLCFVVKLSNPKLFWFGFGGSQLSRQTPFQHRSRAVARMDSTWTSTGEALGDPSTRLYVETKWKRCRVVRGDAVPARVLRTCAAFRELKQVWFSSVGDRGTLVDGK